MEKSTTRTQGKHYNSYEINSQLNSKIIIHREQAKTDPTFFTETVHIQNKSIRSKYMCLCLSGYPFLCLPVCQSVHHTCICSVTFAIKLNSRILFSKICQQIVVLFPTVVFIFSFSWYCKILPCSPNFSS